MDRIRSIFRQIGARNLYTVGLLTIGLLPFLIRYGGFYPWCDTSSQFIPFIMQCKRMLSSGMPLWDWNTFLGDNYLGAYAYYTFTRPHVLLMCLLPYDWIPGGFVVYIYLEFLTIAWLCSYYLRLMGYGRRLRLVGSVLFVFSGYMFSAFEYSMFYDPIWAFLLLLICIERFLQDRKHAACTLVLAAFVVTVINYYFMVSSFIAAAIYFFCRLFSLQRDARRGKLLKAVPCVVLGVLMAAVVLVPVAMYISSSHRSHFDMSFNLPNILERVRCMFMPPAFDGPVPIYTTDSGWYMNSANIAIFGLMFAGMYVWRKPRTWITALIVVYLICYLTPVNGVFSLFTEQCYTRWVYAINLALIIATLEWFRLHEGKKTEKSYTLAYVAVCMAVYLATVGVSVYLRRQADFDAEGFNLLLISVIFFANTLALILVNNTRTMSRRWIAAILVSLAVVSVMQMLAFTFNRSGMGPFPRFTELNIDRWLNDNEFDADRPFEYRYEYLPQDSWIDFKRNSSAVNQRPATGYYLSLRNREYLRFFDKTSESYSPVSFDPSYSRQAFDALVSVRTVVGTDITTRAMKDYDSTALIPTGKPHVYDFAYYIPMGMAYDTYVIDDDSCFTEEFKENHDIVKGMLNSMIISPDDEPLLSRYMQRADFDDSPTLSELVNRRRLLAGDSFRGDTHGFTSTITLPDTMAVFYSVVADNGFTAYIDGQPTKIYNVNFGLSSVIVPAGSHTIRFEYMTPGLKLGAAISLIAWVIFAFVFLVLPKVLAGSHGARSVGSGVSKFRQNSNNK